jgi:hypothetical protein
LKPKLATSARALLVWPVGFLQAKSAVASGATHLKAGLVIACGTVAPLVAFGVLQVIAFGPEETGGANQAAVHAPVAIVEALPELRASISLVEALLPGPYTLVLPNPAGRFTWLAGENPYSIGARVPDLPQPARAVLDQVGLVAATSANLHGGPDPARLEDVPDEIAAAAGALLDAGELPGTPSTVLDLTGSQPRVLREGAVSAAEALETIARVATE